MPQRMNLAKKPVINSDAYWKPSGEEREVPSNQSRIPTAMRVMTPETRCKIDDIAVIGKCIVCKSRLTGLCFFTILPTQLFIIFHPPDLGWKSDSDRGTKCNLTQTLIHHVWVKLHTDHAGNSYYRVIRRPGASIKSSHCYYNSHTKGLETFSPNSEKDHDLNILYKCAYLIWQWFNIYLTYMPDRFIWIRYGWLYVM